MRLDVLLKDTGLTSKDVEILNIPLPARLEGMGNGSIDIAAVSDPWTVRIVNAGYGVVWNPWEKLLPNFQFSVNMYGPNFLEKNPEFGKKYMIAYLKGVRQYNQGKTDRNVEIIAKYTEMKAGRSEAVLLDDDEIGREDRYRRNERFPGLGHRQRLAGEPGAA